MLDIGRHPVSLDRPVGEGEDCSFGEFIEDTQHARIPLKLANNGLLREQDRGAAQDAHLPRAGDHPPALRPGRRLHLHARRGGPHLQGHARARAADRGQGGRQAAAPGAQPLPRSVRAWQHGGERADRRGGLTRWRAIAISPTFSSRQPVALCDRLFLLALCE